MSKMQERQVCTLYAGWVSRVLVTILQTWYRSGDKTESELQINVSHQHLLCGLEHNERKTEDNNCFVLQLQQLQW